MKISKEKFSIRTLTYYQEQGGVYNDIITVLTKLRNEPRHRGLPAPVSILNDACYHLAVMEQMFKQSYEDTENYLAGIKDNLLLCVMSTLADKEALHFGPLINFYVNRNSPFYVKFMPIINRRPVDSGKESKDAGKDLKVASLEKDLELTKGQLATANERIRQLEREQYRLNEESSKADKQLTWNSILDYIESRKNYNFVGQLFTMLNNVAGRYATDEEWARMKKLEEEMLANTLPTVHNHNSISNSNVFQGMMNNPNFPLGADPVALAQAAVEHYLNNLNNGQG